jgi:hypothetical protein
MINYNIDYIQVLSLLGNAACNNKQSCVRFQQMLLKLCDISYNKYAYCNISHDRHYDSRKTMGYHLQYYDSFVN